MPSTSSILPRIKKDHPDISFTKSTVFRWAPEEHTVYYADENDAAKLLHETAHALLDHKAYKNDVELLVVERQAWDTAVSELSKKYDVAISEDEIENMLDTYRDWLHSRSLCPICEATGLQTGKQSYSCPACTTQWRVNEARTCALRRYKTK